MPPRTSSPEGQASNLKIEFDDYTLQDIPLAEPVDSTGPNTAAPPSEPDMQRQASDGSIGDGARFLCFDCGRLKQEPSRIESRMSINKRNKALCRLRHKRYGEYGVCIRGDGKTKPCVIKFGERCCTPTSPAEACRSILCCPIVLARSCCVSCGKCLDSTCKRCTQCLKDTREECCKCCKECYSGDSASASANPCDTCDICLCIVTNDAPPSSPSKSDDDSCCQCCGSSDDGGDCDADCDC